MGRYNDKLIEHDHLVGDKTAMEMTPWDPWSELERLRTEMDRLWNGYLAKLGRVEPGPDRISFLPDVDLVETKDDFRVFVSVPGLVEEDIDLSVRDHILTVRGERQPPYDPQRHRKRLGEWRYGFFERRIRFPQPVRPSAVKATYEAGVLTIVVSKPKE